MLTAHSCKAGQFVVRAVQRGGTQAQQCYGTSGLHQRCYRLELHCEPADNHAAQSKFKLSVHNSRHWVPLPSERVCCPHDLEWLGGPRQCRQRAILASWCAFEYHIQDRRLLCARNTRRRRSSSCVHRESPQLLLLSPYLLAEFHCCEHEQELRGLPDYIHLLLHLHRSDSVPVGSPCGVEQRTPDQTDVGATARNSSDRDWLIAAFFDCSHTRSCESVHPQSVAAAHSVFQSVRE